MAELNPEILKWARQTAGLDLETAARKIGLNAARGVPGTDRLAGYETGNSRPSMSLLRRMARQYHRPLLTFYLPKVPAPAELGQDFRTLPDQGSPSNVLLAALLRDVKARQALVRATIEDDEDATAVTLVGSQRGVTDPLRLSVALVAAIGFDRAEFRNRQSAEDAFAYLRARVEAVGVFVLLAGDCGSWQTAVEVSIFRGFAITDDLAPFVVINDQDAKAAWSFTLLHELAHLLLDEPGISGGAPTAGIEQLCNDAAAATLIAPDELADLPLEGGAGDIVAIGELADRCRVSRGMVAYQLFRAKRLPLRRWEELRDRFREEWLAKKAATRAASRVSPGGPSWYVLRRHRLGAALLDIAREGIADGSLTPTRAARMLGVKPMSVYPLLAGTGRSRITT
ncbi:helix-turn-helix domain-containing protein [Aurantimonas marianensis]|uniref:Helix-turn-helix domain-containing protein n=1 Tax=Aurantimonas marianensis TaxID=2920428 RepID=A0A9X2HAG4_9HYPH|nr:helix-turn-helix transcriptional regulator [Aurantimonas marianensis]MCP3056788.1 helix-turn-helix domain-containing protein [Aurantimonas marianensis]